MKRKIYRNALLLLAVALASACALAATGGEFQSRPGTNPLTREGAIRLALENNPPLRAADSQTRSAAGRSYLSK